MIKNASNSQKTQPTLGIRKRDGTLDISDEGETYILNEHFSTVVSVGEELADEFLGMSDLGDSFNYITRIKPTAMHITLSNDTPESIEGL